jgi:hypothetical protein
MDDLTANEIEALQYAGDMAGEFLEEKGKTNLEALDSDEWMQFIECIVGNYVTKLQELSEQEAPF